MSAKSKALNILLIEDDKEEAALISTILEKKYNTSLIYDGKEGYDYLLHPKEIPDIVLLDYHLPQMKADEIMSKLKEKGKEYIYIVLTADKDTSTVVKSIKAGAQDFIHKSVDLKNELPIVIDKVWNITHELYIRDKYLHAITNSIPEVIFIFDEEGRYIDIIAGKEKLLFKKESELKGKKLHELSKKEVADKFVATIKRSLEKNDIETLNYKVPTPSGLRYMEGRCAPIEMVVKGKRCVILVARDITDREKAEEALKESEERFRLLFERHSAPMLLIDPDSGKIIDANPSASEFYRYPREKLMSINISDINQLSPEEVEKARQKAKAENMNYFVFPHKLADGNIKEVEVHSSPVNIQGRTLLFSIIHDITERKRMERKIIELSHKDELILSSLGEGVYSVNKDGNTVFINPAMLKMIGYKEEEVLGKNLHNLIHHTKSDGTHYPMEECQGMYKALKDKSPQLINDEVFWRKDGTSFIVEYLSTPILENGDVVGVVGIVRDITKRKEAEEKIKESEHGLSEAQRIAHIGNWEWNIETNELRWSDEIYRIFGLSPQQFGATYPAFLNTIHPDDRTMVVNAVNEAVNDNKPYSLEHRIIRPDGSIRNVIEQGEVTRDENGKALKMIGIVQDITKQKLYEQQLQEANAAKDKFFSIIAHDLKNPFNALLGSAEALHDNLDDLEQEDIHDLSNIIYRSSKNAYTLLENLLEWSRSQLGRIKFEPHEIPLRDIIYECVKSVEGQAQHKGLSIKDNTQDTNIYADINLIKTILRNLLSNAIKYTESGGKITLSSEHDDNGTKISVSDTGVGMPPETLEKIFKIDTKYSTPGTAKETGTGLGLILCKEFVERHGGEIWVESEVGKGTTFMFSLPNNKEHG